MEIDVTEFVVNGEDPGRFSASIAELGPDARWITWKNSMKEARSTVMLDTPDKVQALKDYCGEMGAWDEAEIEDWSDQHCNAMFIQEVSARLREIESDGCMTDEGLPDYEAYAVKRDGGGPLYAGDNGRHYFYLGS